MLRTTNKQVTERLRIDVLDNFCESAEYKNEHEKRYSMGTYKPYGPLEMLIEQIDAMQYGGRSVYQTALDYVEGGSYLVYYQDVQEYLKGLLQWQAGDPEYSDDKAWRLYCHLIARTMSKLYMEGK